MNIEILIMNYIALLLKEFSEFFPNLSVKIGRVLLPAFIKNINLDITIQNQKRILISYLSPFQVNTDKVIHSNYHQYYQIIHYFLENNYCVDLCYCSEKRILENIQGVNYDVILGFGIAYKEALALNTKAKKILFITENNPTVVKSKYSERLQYFKMRHPHISYKNNILRNDYYDEEQLRKSDEAILMSSEYNAKSFRSFFPKLYLINGNALVNRNYKFDKERVKEWAFHSQNHFLWLGSTGLIHRGVDLLLDVFKELPDLEIDFYGISSKEKALFNKLKSNNTHNCGYINIQSETFITEVIRRHNFIIFPSCSEGMSTSICTCMAHGIIPIVTKETGIDSNAPVIVIDEWTIESITRTILSVLSMNIDEIVNMREQVFIYASQHYTIDTFNNQFHEIMDSILYEKCE